MRFFAIRDSNDVEKNLANQVTDYVWNIWQKDNRTEVKPNYFFTEARPKFLLAAGTADRDVVTDTIYIIPPIANATTFLQDSAPSYPLDTHALMDVMDSDEAVFIVAPDLPHHVTWVEMHKSLRTVVIDRKTGDFLDWKTREKVCRDEPSKMALFMAMFRMGKMPIYVAITNSDYLENKCWDDFKGTDLQYISVLKESRSVKDEIFSPAYRNGFVTQVGKHEMFVCGNEFSVEMFGEYLVEIPSVAQAIYEDSMIYPHKNYLMDMSDHIKAYSNWPTTVDEVGVVRVDMSNIPNGSTGFLRVEIEGGEFFKYWIYKTHRSIYEYVLHKTEPMTIDQQGSIQSPGFY
jgi:hypothetical protein